MSESTAAAALTANGPTAPNGAIEVKNSAKNGNDASKGNNTKSHKKGSNARPKASKQQQQQQIYALPAPICTFPLPSFYPNNPLSLFHVLYAWLRQTIAPPPREPATVHKGIWSASTRSVHIVDQQAIRALWEQGFFGKGIYSRSEPNWLKREQARRGEDAGHVAETLTAQRRKERNQMKWERARKEQEAIQRTRAQEAWVAPVGPMELLALPNSVIELGLVAESHAKLITNGHAIRSESPLVTVNGLNPDSKDEYSAKLSKTVRFSPKVEATTFEPLDPPSPGAGPYTKGQAVPANDGLFASAKPEDMNALPVAATTGNGLTKNAKPTSQKSSEVGDIKDIEHLQLAPEEAFYLSFAMGVLDIIDPTTGQLISPKDQFQLYWQISANPRVAPSIQRSLTSSASSITLSPDDPFLLHYATYHHFRSLGWVVRPGIKFGVDWLLYHRGPVFSHAEFALLVLPAYTHPWWKSEEAVKARGRKGLEERRSWHWLHCANRVQAKALKTLVLVYVDVPPPRGAVSELKGGQEEEESIADVLSRYKIREFMVKRWLSNRNRD